jgi:hypothetical protein
VSKYLKQLSPEEAKTVLLLLAKESRELASQIGKMAKAIISDVDDDEVADEVYWELTNIDVEALWNRSGSSRFGYVEPVEAAYEMVEEVLEPFAEQLKKYRKLDMFTEVNKMGLGLAKGILKFTKEGQTEFKEWAQDDPLDWLDGLLMEWEKECKDVSEKECIREIHQLLRA